MISIKNLVSLLLSNSVLQKFVVVKRDEVVYVLHLL